MRLRRDKIVVALEHKVLMYNFADLRLEHSIETLSNPTGLVALSPCPEHNVLACPGLHCGQARNLPSVLCAYVKNMPPSADLFHCRDQLSLGDMCNQVRVELYDVRRTKFIQAHTSALACIALSQDGKMLATASERGTLVRIHSTTDGTKLQVAHPMMLLKGAMLLFIVLHHLNLQKE